jgi:phenylacetate-CoA ligase
MTSGPAPVPGTDDTDRPHWWHHTGMRRLAALAPGWRLYDEVQRHTQYDRELRTDMQRRRLRTVLDIAPRGAATAPADPDPFAELSRWPVMPKRRFLAELDGLRTNLVEPPDLLRVSTSGKTGDPVVIDHEEQLLVENLANQLRMFAAYGLSPGVRVLRVSCDPRHPLVTFVPQPVHATSVQVRLNVCRVDDVNADFVGRLCREFAPEVVWGPPMEQLVAARKIRSGLLGGLSPRMLWTYGDQLDAHTRQVLTTVYAAPLRDLYSLDEFGSLAWECPEAPGTYHINEERVLVERADDGALVMTNLINRAMAIIRYRPEDRARLLPEPCPCGRTLRRIADIEGRQRGMLVDRTGTLLSVEPLRVHLEALPLRRWRVSQDEPGTFTVSIVPTDEVDARALADGYAELFDQNAVTVRAVSADELDPDGDRFRLIATQRHLAGRIP